MRSIPTWALLVFLSLSGIQAAPPPVAREFRGMWIASVGNIDWPSRAGLPAAQQQAELRALLDDARRLNLNTVILQVRTSADALYESELEPWSEYLSGRMGVAPNPKWDPLKFACEEAHQRGLELHAWINPFRARHFSVKTPAAQSHISKTRPAWTVVYGGYLWIDPGNVEAQEHTLKVVTDIVRRYDIDGLHIDDYFYPYPEYSSFDNSVLLFDDSRSYQAYRRKDGRLALDDWRRDNINQFVARLGTQIHGEKAWVKFGISPFGIWRFNVPQGIKGLDQFTFLYADAKLWLNEGLADYFAPQLYWPMNRKEQDYTALLRWWASQNTKSRVLAPGLSSTSIGKDRQSGDIVNQVRVARELKADGVIFWSAGSLRSNKGGLANLLARDAFKTPALSPATTWLGTNAPAVPDLKVELQGNGARAEVGWTLQKQEVEPARALVLQTRVGNQWQTEILGATNSVRGYDLRRGVVIPDELWLYGIGRTGIAGDAATWTKPVTVPARR